jgi:hypothetical protein
VALDFAFVGGVWEYFRDFVAAVAGLCHVSCGFGFACVWENFRDFVAAVAGFVSCELWLWIALCGCGKFSAISLRLLPECCAVGFGLCGKILRFRCGGCRYLWVTFYRLWALCAMPCAMPSQLPGQPRAIWMDLKAKVGLAP